VMKSHLIVFSRTGYAGSTSVSHRGLSVGMFYVKLPVHPNP
jgi:hypothetical protein